MRSFSKRPLGRNALPLLLSDITSVVVSFWLALAFRFDGRIPEVDLRVLFLALPAIVAIFIVSNLAFGLYRYVWRYTSANEVLMIGTAAATSTFLLLGVSMMWKVGRPVPLSVAGLGGVFSCGMFTAFRYRQRLLTGLMGYLQRVVGSPDRQRVLVIGAGEAAHLLARQLKTDDGKRRYELVGFVDDDPRKHGQRTYGAQVLGDRHA